MILFTCGLRLTRGKVGSEAVRKPSPDELEGYARTLRDDLDGFVGESSSIRHRVDLLFGGESGLVGVDIIRDSKVRQPVRVLQATDDAANQMQTARSLLTERRSQWLYFNRNLRIYDGTRTYILKPLQRLHWTETQAMEDAGEIIADSLQTRSSESTQATGIMSPDPSEAQKAIYRQAFVRNCFILLIARIC